MAPVKGKKYLAMKVPHPNSLGGHLSDSHKTSISISKTGKSNGRLGKKINDKTRKKMSDSAIGNKNAVGSMKDDVTYREAHMWAKKNIKTDGLEKCPCCGTFKCPICGKYGLIHRCNIDHKYRRINKDWFFACPSCHRKIDKKNKLIVTRWTKERG